MRPSKPLMDISLNTKGDPDRNPNHIRQEPAICEICDAIYLHRRWNFGSALHDIHKKYSWTDVHRTVCPACRKDESGDPRGFLYVSGQFLAQHHAEILQLVENEARQAGDADPEARILTLGDLDADWITVSTTTEALAEQIGFALSKAFGGDLIDHYSKQSRRARVSWHRD